MYPKQWRRPRASPLTLQAIGEQANGDLHNAISTLQFVCTGVAPTAPPPAAAKGKGKARGTKRKTAAGLYGGKGQSAVGYAGRDSTLSLFHALGKLLYNKRLPEGAGGGGQTQQQTQQEQQQAGLEEGPDQPSSSKRQWTANGFWQAAAAGAPAVPLAAWAQRAPMEFNPEAVLAAAGLEAGGLAERGQAGAGIGWCGGTCMLHTRFFHPQQVAVLPNQTADRHHLFLCCSSCLQQAL